MLIFALLSLASLSMPGRTKAQEMITISAGPTSKRTILDKVLMPFEKQTGIKIKYVGKNSEEGNGVTDVIRDVESGVAEVGCTATLTSKIQEILRDPKMKIKDPDDFHFKLLGHDIIAFIVSRDLDGIKLSKKDLQNIFLGKVINWKAFGAIDLPVTPLLQPSRKAVHDFVQSQILDDKPFGTEKHIVELPERKGAAGMIEAIEGKPGAIGYGGRRLATDKVGIAEIHRIGRPIMLCFKGKPREKLNQLIKFIEISGPELGIDP